MYVRVYTFESACGPGEVFLCREIRLYARCWRRYTVNQPCPKRSSYSYSYSSFSFRVLLVLVTRFRSGFYVESVSDYPIVKRGRAKGDVHDGA